MKLIHLYMLYILLPILHMQAADHQKKQTVRFGIDSGVSVAIPSSRATSQLISKKSDHFHSQINLQEKQLELEEQQRKLQKEQQELEQLIQQGIKHEHTFSDTEKGNVILPLGALLNLGNQKKRHLTQQTELNQQRRDLTERITQAENQIPEDIHMYLINDENAPNILKQWIDLLDRKNKLLMHTTKTRADINTCIQHITKNILDRLLTDASAMKATRTWFSLKQERAALDTPLSKIDDNLHSINSAIVANSESLRAAFNYFVTNDIATLTQYIINEKRNEALSKNPEMNPKDITFSDQELRTAIFNFKVKQLGNNLSSNEYALLHSIIPTIPLNINNPAEIKQNIYHLNTPENLIKFSKSLLKNRALCAKRVDALNADAACNIFQISLTDEEKQAATLPTLVGEQLQKIASAEQCAAIKKQYPQYDPAPVLIEDPTVGMADASDEPQHIHTIQTILQATVQEYCNILPSHLKSSQDAVKVSRGLLHMMELIQKRIKFLHNRSGCPLDIIEDIILTEQEEEDVASGWRCHQIMQNIIEDDFSNTLPESTFVRQESVKPTQKKEQNETQMSFFDLDAVADNQEEKTDGKQDKPSTSQSGTSWFEGWL